MSKLQNFRLTLLRVESWPKFNVPWTSVLDLDFFAYTFPGDLFSDVMLHHSLPNLRSFSISFHELSCFTLPDMKECKDLTFIWIFGSEFILSSLPPNLHTFTGRGKIINMSRAAFKVRHTRCELIGEKLIFDTEEN